jgi:hypothetical protein
MALPQLQAAGQNIEAVFTQMQTLWAAIINPVIARPQNSSTILPKLSLVTGDNIIPHTLNRALIGWSVVRQRSAATFYDKQDDNRTPAINLVLNASADVVIDLEVF